MTIRSIRNAYEQRLHKLYDRQEIRSIFGLLTAEFLGYQPHQLSLHLEDTPDPAGIRKLGEALERLERAEPVQYIMGYTDFDGLRISVGPGVLVPRPETAELLLWITDGQVRATQPRILDVCTGSGCIALGLKNRWPDAEVLAFDKSKAAVNFAQANSANLDLPIQVFRQDVFEPWDLMGSFDLVVCNPPYILPAEKDLMHKNVLEHEPAEALFTPVGDPLVFYREIGQKAKDLLKPGGWLYFEINEAYGQDLEDLLRRLGYRRTEVRKDFLEKDRFARAQWDM